MKIFLLRATFSVFLIFNVLIGYMTWKRYRWEHARVTRVEIWEFLNRSSVRGRTWTWRGAQARAVLSHWKVVDENLPSASPILLSTFEIHVFSGDELLWNRQFDLANGRTLIDVGAGFNQRSRIGRLSSESCDYFWARLQPR